MKNILQTLISNDENYSEYKMNMVCIISSYSGLNPVNNFEGVHRDFTYWIDSMKFESETSYVNYTKRLRALVTQVRTSHRESFVAVCHFITTFEAYFIFEPGKGPQALRTLLLFLLLLSDFQKFPEALSIRNRS